MKKAIMSVLTAWILVNASLLSLLIFSPEKEIKVSAATTIIVDDDGTLGVDCNYTHIQWAIDNASDGDTIFVKNGTYYENVVVNKAINLTGEDRDTTIIDGNGSEDVVRITADSVHLSGFTIINSGNQSSWPNYDAGIEIYSSKNNIIMGNNISNNMNGIYSYLSRYNNITNNNISLNNDDGIYFDASMYNNISKNNISDNDGDGIHLSQSSINSIKGNNIRLNDDNGIYIYWSSIKNIITNNNASGNGNGIVLWSSSFINVTNNTLSNSHRGMYIFQSSDNNISNNNIYSNSNSGIVFSSSSNNNVTENRVINSGQGIYFGSSSNNNKIINNTVLSNDFYGIRVYSSSNNSIIGNEVSDNGKSLFSTSSGLSFISATNNNITRNVFSSNCFYGLSLSESSNNNTLHHNNIIDNMEQVYLDNATCFDNIWNDSNGEGNYWSDYAGVDDGSGGRIAGDGVGDTEIPHPFIDQGDGYYQLDNYPLVSLVGNYIFLYSGWNLISIPFNQSNTNLGSVLSSINGSYDSVQWYNISDTADPWKHNHTSKPPHMNDFEDIDHKMGFWVHNTEPGGVLFEYTGTQPTSNQSIPLHPGWNMVGYPSLTNRNRTAALNNLTFGVEVDSVWTHDPASKKWEEIGPSDYFQVGRGYWIHAKAECEWEVGV
ncbi:MAG: right-handed parallel beta-helix repeat-containing protein [Thermoplasmata archaeon]|nr:MAG: right-handed parallel beta-helix repeat-containing protein [Thermoplasmata archaeon]